MMKMQHTNAARWLGNLPPVLSRIFAARETTRQKPHASGAEATETPHSRWTWEQSDGDTARKANRHFTGRPEIMVPVDFSTTCDGAVEYAIKVARRARARLILLHAVHLNLTPYGPANPAWLRSALCREALQKMQGIMAQAHCQGVPAISVIEQGAPASVIARAARRWKIDLIVMVSQKRSRWARFFGQKIVEKVTRDAGCPVMVIHPEANKGATV
jgi:nucleotide-binding universal stress UspA family protein